jgi:hypothetical protein
VLAAKGVMCMEPKDVSRPSLQIGVPTIDAILLMTIHNVLRKLLWLHDYKIQFPHEIKFTDPLNSVKYSNLMFNEIRKVFKMNTFCRQTFGP